MLSSAARLVEIIPDPSRTPFRDWPELFGFIAESVFTFIPESCSGSPRNTVRNHPGIAFTFLRIPQGKAPKQRRLQVIDFKWWPGTESNRRRQPFQGLLPNWRSGLKSTYLAVGKRVMRISI